MRQLAIAACLISLAACGGSPSSGPSPSPSASPGSFHFTGPSASPALTLVATGAVETKLAGAGSCVISTSVIGGKPTKSFIFAGLKNADGALLYISAFPYTGATKYTNIGKPSGTQVTLFSFKSPKSPISWLSKTGSVTVAHASADRADGSIDADLSGGPSPASPTVTHISGTWSCSITTSEPPQASPAPSPSPSR